jgi:ATP-dependent DNA helicase RecG
MIGKDESIKKFIPGAGLSFQVLKNSDVRVNDVHIKSIPATFDSALDHLQAWNAEREIPMGLLRIGIPDFDKRAFREALVNAFAHRNYAQLNRVRVQIDDDGLLISSPGGFVEGITIHNLLTAEPRSRNPALADVLKRIGLAERTGRGIDRIFEGALVYGRPLPDYSISDSMNVRLFIPRANPDEAFTKLIAEAMQNPSFGANVFALLILYELRHARRATLEELVEKAQTDKSRVRTIVERLIETGYLESTGNARGRTYTLSAKIYRMLNESVSYVRQTDIDRIRYPELILKLAAKKGSIRRADVMELLRLTGPQAYKQLKSLVDEGKLQMSGQKTTATYTLNRNKQPL